jgi:DNA mismatch repair protein MutS
MNESAPSLTPLMRQYYEIKNKFPDTLVFFQVGDFYELFDEDAKKASAFLGITLTKRGHNGVEAIPLAGVPVHAIDHYLIKLVRGGFRVVLCDQLTKPVPGKIVERGIKQVLTPGTLTDMKMLQEKSASYLASFVPLTDSYGLVFTEILTGQIFATVMSAGDEKMLEAELARFLPDEIIVPDTKLGKQYEQFFKKRGYVVASVSLQQDVLPQPAAILDWLSPFASQGAVSFIEHSDVALQAISLMYYYLKTTCESALEHCKQFFLYDMQDFLILDVSTQRNLELITNLHDGTREHTLLSVLDKAATAMGSRTIKKWVQRPLLRPEQIEQRLDAVELFMQSSVERNALIELLKQCGDLERIVGRIALGRSLLQDYVGLMQVMTLLPNIHTILGTMSERTLLNIISNKLGDYKQLHDMLRMSLNDDPEQDMLIKPGFNAELDRLRSLVNDAAQAILALEQREQVATGIQSLKIKFNKVHGYGIEVTKANLSSVPGHYIRLQTLANRERFTTQELKDLEFEISRAHASISEVEQEIYKTMCAEVGREVASLKKTAQALAHLDALLGLAQCGYEHNYVRPVFNNQRDLVIHNGRHPVVELTEQHSFIPNDTQLTDEQSLWIITGPNMGGKSTYLRQVALISIMAQAGSFVPAQAANLSIVDRIFTRIGSSDHVAAGKSTFLVEMEEAALICTHATAQSLIILDEVGRGTSTYDGLALAQAIIEYLYQKIQARCLFATHYHELTALADQMPGLVAYHAASKEMPDGVLLLHKIVRGKADGSFGLEVARRAGLPNEILSRAQAILTQIKGS